MAVALTSAFSRRAQGLGRGDFRHVCRLPRRRYFIDHQYLDRPQQRIQRRAIPLNNGDNGDNPTTLKDLQGIGGDCTIVMHVRGILGPTVEGMGWLQAFGIHRDWLSHYAVSFQTPTGEWFTTERMPGEITLIPGCRPDGYIPGSQVQVPLSRVVEFIDSFRRESPPYSFLCANCQHYTYDLYRSALQGRSSLRISLSGFKAFCNSIEGMERSNHIAAAEGSPSHAAS